MNIFYLKAACLSIFIIFQQLSSVFAIHASDPPAESARHNLDIRPVYSYVNTTDRDHSKQTDHSLNLRVRYGISYPVRKNLTFRVRAATRLSTNQSNYRFLMDPHTGGSGSYPAGTFTADEFFVGWHIKPELRLTAGRFQGRFPLEGFIPKGVDRYYAANLAISHTDGIWVQWDLNDRWLLHLIGNYNSSKGSSHAARSPLRFDESPAARFTGFANIQHRKTKDRWAQREFSISVTPQNFYRDGALKNHLALSTRWMYRPGFTISGEEYLLGGEIGFIPVAPRRIDAGFQIHEERLLFNHSAVSWQLAAYANQLFKHHRVGILYGQTDPNWLISSSFAPNVTMAEMRYRFTIASWVHYEFRVRLRDEIYQPSDADKTRQIFDFYTRFTFNFRNFTFK